MPIVNWSRMLPAAAGLVLGAGSMASAVTLDIQPIGLATASQLDFDEGTAEIPAYDPISGKLFVVNAKVGVDVFDLSDPSNPLYLNTLSAPGTNSVAVYNGIVALAVENANKQSAGTVQFFNTDGLFQGAVGVGSLPDMLTFTPDGTKVIVANEAEPNDDYTIDPVGSVSIIDVSGGYNVASVTTAGFEAYNGSEDALRDLGIRIFGPGASAAQDFEPEYVAVSADSSTAYVSLQENNAIAVVDLATSTVTDVLPLGYKDYGQTGNGIDASDKDDAIDIKTRPGVLGMYQPDTIAAYTLGGETYIVTANEGDSRDYDGFSEEARVDDLTLDESFGTPAEIAALQESENLGRLKTTTVNGDTDGDGDVDQIYSYGARSFSIWKQDAMGNLIQVFDSGDAFEQITAATLPEAFNSNNDENDSFDACSDDKGPEPEGITLGQIDGHTYAFIGLERMGGIMVYDITDPENPEFCDYIFETRNYSVDLSIDADNDDIPDNLAAAGDLGPEGMLFIDAADSPTGVPLLIVANEISGTTRIYSVEAVPSPATVSVLGMGVMTLLGGRRRNRRQA
ncbi:alkaline phosphatase [Planctomycetales bacterium ZRK34]|nr:alkaline phosphatase [Planctomycetales bacterium ZRK34]